MLETLITISRSFSFNRVEMVGKKRKLSGGDALTPKESIELKRLKQTVESLTAQLRDRDEQELRMNSQIMDLRQQLESLRHQVDLAQPRVS